MIRWAFIFTPGSKLLDCYLHLIASFLSERTFCVRVDESILPREESLLASAKDSDHSPPLLFSIYVNEYRDSLESR